MTEQEFKHCTRCGEGKPLDAFQRKGANDERRRSICRKCDALKRKLERKRKQDAIREHKPRGPVYGVQVPMTEVEYQRRLRAAENMR